LVSSSRRQIRSLCLCGGVARVLVSFLLFLCKCSTKLVSLVAKLNVMGSQEIAIIVFMRWLDFVINFEVFIEYFVVKLELTSSSLLAI